MIADYEKGDFIGELEQNAILESGADFPIVGMPVLQAEAGRQGGMSIEVVHKDIESLIDFFLTGGLKFFEAAVKTNLEFVLHFISSGVLDVCGRPWNPRSVCPALFLID